MTGNHDDGHALPAGGRSASPTRAPAGRDLGRGRGAGAPWLLRSAHGHLAWAPSTGWSRFGLSANLERRGRQRPPVLPTRSTEFIPWTCKLAWTQVHHGHLPLWNSSTASSASPWPSTGRPATFQHPGPGGLPLRTQPSAYTVQVVATLLIAGTGVYVLGRVLRLERVVSCKPWRPRVLRAERAPSSGWLGWPIASVMSWAGWLCAAAVLVVRGGHRARAVIVLAVARRWRAPSTPASPTPWCCSGPPPSCSSPPSSWPGLPHWPGRGRSDSLSSTPCSPWWRGRPSGAPCSSPASSSSPARCAPARA